MTPTRAIVLAAVLLQAGCWVLVPELDTGAGSGGSAGDAASGGTGGAVSSGGAGGEAASGGAGGAGGSGGCGLVDPQSYAETVLYDCPIAYWRLGEAPCGNPSCIANNELSSTQQGTYQGGFTLGEPGALLNDPDTSVFLNTQQNGHIDVAPTISFPNLAPFSLEIWVKPSEDFYQGVPNCDVVGLLAQDGPQTGCSGVPNPFPGYRLKIDSDCRFEFEMLECNGPKVELRSEPYTESRWYHLVATFDGTQPRLYIDGLPIDNTVSGAMAVLSDEPTHPFTIGGRGGGDFGQIDGWLDEPAVYDYALPVDRLQAHFAASGR